MKIIHHFQAEDILKEKVEDLLAGKLNPSDVSWKIIEEAKLVDDFFSTILRLEHTNLDMPNLCTGAELVDNFIAKVSRYLARENEGFAMTIVSTVLMHLLDELNKRSGHSEGAPLYQSMLYPMVTKAADARKSKKSDYFVLKVVNRRVYIIVEVKLDVPQVLSGGMKNQIAQLFVEAYYTYHHCPSLPSYSQFLCVLTDGFTWHCFLLQMDCIILTVAKYFKLKDTVSVCNVFTDMILNNGIR